MAETLKLIKLADIKFNADNLRTDGTEDIQELADSIAFVGVLEPPVVCKDGMHYQLVAGERRVRACKLNKMTEIKCIVRTGLTDEKIMAAFLIENMQRVDLTAVEQAEGVIALAVEHGFTEAEIAKNLGVSKQWVKDRIGIHTLPDHVKPAVGVKGGVPVAHAGMLAALPADRIERLTKDDKVPSPYDIETQVSKVASEAKGDLLFRKLRKQSVLVVTEKELKRIVKADISSLSGDDWTIKSMLGDASEVVTDYWRQVEHTVVHLARIFKFDGSEVDKKTLYVQRKNGGFIEWAWAKVIPGKGMANPDKPDADKLADELDARNEEREAKHRAACEWAEMEYVTNTKPAALTSELLWSIALQINSGYQSFRRAALAAERLGLEFTAWDRDADLDAQRAAHELNVDALIKYGNKSGANLVRLAATIEMVAGKHGFDVAYPDPPEMEEHPDMEEA